eukprot:CAMPEP_0196699760 /NCGR_PEP_ID=MMETSP1090-20130531/47746_1 /TAXON_ID=37098 /ORGANISM="Isochrysis sp, Strain CCMP1244" /LENGTH=70 /DNA_ID=CAMNT_0042039471 /DNA_START=153 /DNA_END=363 /DNA_ORIENTATION=-
MRVVQHEGRLLLLFKELHDPVEARKAANGGAAEEEAGEEEVAAAEGPAEERLVPRMSLCFSLHAYGDLVL